MIQRIQTLFLTVTAGFLISMLFIPMVRDLNNIVEPIKYYVQDYISLILLIVTIVLCIITIFSYKKRIFQIRVCNLNSLILLGFQISLMARFFLRKDGEIFNVSMVFPIAAAILTFIAMRYIARDEALVAASSRLRSSKSDKKKHKR